MRARISSVDHNRLLSYPRDGLLDIFLGLTFVVAGTFVDSADAPLSGLAVVLISLLVLTKEGIVATRLDEHDLDDFPKPWRAGLAGVVVGSTALLVVQGLVMSGVLLPAPERSGHSSIWGMCAIAALALIAVVGSRIGARRFVAYSSAAALVLAGVLWLDVAGASSALIGLGAITSIAGGVLFARFLRDHPRKPGTTV